MVLDYYHKDRLLTDVRGMFHQDFLAMGITPQQCIEDQLASGTKEQYRVFIKEVGHICESYTNSDLEFWFFKEAGYWNPKDDLRAELLHGVDVAKINLKALFHKDWLVTLLKHMSRVNFRMESISPREFVERLLKKGSDSQLQAFIEQVGHACGTYSDSDLKRWIFEDLDYWNPEDDLRAELLQGVEIAKVNLQIVSRKERLVDDVRAKAHHNLLLVAITLQDHFEGIFETGTEVQLEAFVEQVGHICDSYTDKDLKQWFFEHAYYWDPEEDLRAELLQGVEIAKGVLKALRAE